MKQTIFDLLKAMINATLILLALCLFLGWMLMSSVQDVTVRVTEAVLKVTPVQDRIQDLRVEVAGLRSDLVNLPEQVVIGQLDRLDQRLTSLQHEMSELRQLPNEIIHNAAQTAATTLADQLSQPANCLPPSS